MTAREPEHRDVRRSVQLCSLFRALARDVGARYVWPSTDGSLVFFFKGTARLEDGSPLFDLGQSERRAVLFWHPRTGPGLATVTGLAGGFRSKGLQPSHVQSLTDRIGRVAVERSEGGIAPFAPSSGEHQDVELSSRFVRTAMASFLEENVTRWGRFILREAEPGVGAVALRFEAPDELVRFELRDAASVGSADERGVCVLASPLVLRVVEDTRSRRTLDRPEDLVERYLLYALLRALSPSAIVRAPPEESPRSDPPATPPRDAAAAGGDSGTPPPPPDLERLTPWPRLSEDGFDSRDESPPNAFFIHPGERTLGAFEKIATLLEADEGVALVTYAHPACYGKLPSIDFPDHVGWMWHRYSPIPMAIPRKRVRATDMPEMDMVLGEEARFRSGLDKAVADPRTRIVAVVTTCIVDCIGLDHRGVIAEASAGSAKPVVQVKAATENAGRISEFWADMFAVARRDIAAVPGTVNLVGFLSATDPAAVEIERDIAALGLEVNGFVVPSFRTAQVERFFRSEWTIASTDALSASEFRGVRERFPEMRVIDLAPPFGPSATRSFYDALCSLCAPGPESGQVASLWERHRADWQRWHERARGHVAVVLTSPELAVLLTEPRLLYGIHLVPLLREMGFAVRVGCLSDDGASAHGAEVARETAEQLTRLFAGDAGVVVDAVDPSEPVDAYLPRIGASIVFSEYPPDARIVRTRRLSFHPRDLEMGFAGAVRSIARLVRKAECRFFSTFAPSTGGGDA